MAGKVKAVEALCWCELVAQIAMPLESSLENNSRNIIVIIGAGGIGYRRGSLLLGNTFGNGTLIQCHARVEVNCPERVCREHNATVGAKVSAKVMATVPHVTVLCCDIWHMRSKCQLTNGHLTV